MKINHLNFIETAGGPFILLTAEDANKWQGVRADHYEKACEIYDELSNLNIDDISSIVLGTENYPTSYCIYDDGIVIIRWIAGENVSSLIKLLNLSNELIFKSDSYVIFNTKSSGIAYLIDSGAPGSESEALQEGIKMSLLPNAEYKINSKYLQLDNEHQVLVHNMYQS